MTKTNNLSILVAVAATATLTTAALTVALILTLDKPLLTYLKFENNFNHPTTQLKRKKASSTKQEKRHERSTYSDLIGKTPMVKLHNLSHLLNCDILVKMESMNPGKLMS